MPTTISKLFSTGILQTLPLDEVTYNSIKVNSAGVYAAEFDEVNLTGAVERRTSSGTYLVSGHFDEYALTLPQATGGTVNTYSSGSTNYKTHTFSSTDTFIMTNSGTVDVLLVGGGGGGSLGYNSGPYHSPGNGGDGGYAVTQTTYLTAGTYNISIGNSASFGYNAANFAGGTGSTTTAFGFTAAGGQGGQNTRLNQAGTTNGIISSISGSSIQYGQGGPITAGLSSGASGANGTGNGGSSGGDGNFSGGAGGTGVVIVRYIVS